MRFHLIDRVESWTPSTSITARKVTSIDEYYWQPGPDGPVQPFGLTLEAVCQAATWLIMLSTDFRKRAALLAVDHVVSHRQVRLGEVLQLHADIESMNDGGAVIDGQVSVDGRPVLDATGILCALIDVAELSDPVETRLMGQQLTGQLSATSVSR